MQSTAGPDSSMTLDPKNLQMTFPFSQDHERRKMSSSLSFSHPNGALNLIDVQSKNTEDRDTKKTKTRLRISNPFKNRKSKSSLDLRGDSLDQEDGPGNMWSDYSFDGLDDNEHKFSLGRDIESLFCKDCLNESITIMMQYLYVVGSQTEGIFRKSVSKVKTKKLRLQLDSTTDTLSVILNFGVRVVGSAVQNQEFDVIQQKHSDIIRHLPQPLLDGKWMKLASVPDEQKWLELVNSLLQKLPPKHEELLLYLLCVLHNISDNCEVNFMTSHNVAVCWSQTLFKPLGEEISLIDSIHQSQTMIDIIKRLIEKVCEVFPANRLNRAREILRSRNLDELADKPLGRSDSDDQILNGTGKGFESTASDVSPHGPERSSPQIMSDSRSARGARPFSLPAVKIDPPSSMPPSVEPVPPPRNKKRARPVSVILPDRTKLEHFLQDSSAINKDRRKQAVVDSGFEDSKLEHTECRFKGSCENLSDSNIVDTLNSRSNERGANSVYSPEKKFLRKYKQASIDLDSSTDAEKGRSTESLASINQDTLQYLLRPKSPPVPIRTKSRKQQLMANDKRYRNSVDNSNIFLQNDKFDNSVERLTTVPAELEEIKRNSMITVTISDKDRSSSYKTTDIEQQSISHNNFSSLEQTDKSSTSVARSNFGNNVREESIETLNRNNRDEVDGNSLNESYINSSLNKNRHLNNITDDSKNRRQIMDRTSQPKVESTLDVLEINDMSVDNTRSGSVMLNHNMNKKDSFSRIKNDKIFKSEKSQQRQRRSLEKMKVMSMDASSESSAPDQPPDNSRRRRKAKKRNSDPSDPSRRRVREKSAVARSHSHNSYIKPKRKDNNEDSLGLPKTHPEWFRTDSIKTEDVMHVSHDPIIEKTNHVEIPYENLGNLSLKSHQDTSHTNNNWSLKYYGEHSSNQIHGDTIEAISFEGKDAKEQERLERLDGMETESQISMLLRPGYRSSDITDITESIKRDSRPLKSSLRRHSGVVSLGNSDWHKEMVHEYEQVTEEMNKSHDSNTKRLPSIEREYELLRSNSAKSSSVVYDTNSKSNKIFSSSQAENTKFANENNGSNTSEVAISVRNSLTRNDLSNDNEGSANVFTSKDETNDLVKTQKCEKSVRKLIERYQFSDPKLESLRQNKSIMKTSVRRNASFTQYSNCGFNANGASTTTSNPSKIENESKQPEGNTEKTVSVRYRVRDRKERHSCYEFPRLSEYSSEIYYISSKNSGNEQFKSSLLGSDNVDLNEDASNVTCSSNNLMNNNVSGLNVSETNNNAYHRHVTQKNSPDPCKNATTGARTKPAETLSEKVHTSENETVSIRNTKDLNNSLSFHATSTERPASHACQRHSTLGTSVRMEGLTHSASSIQRRSSFQTGNRNETVQQRDKHQTLIPSNTQNKTIGSTHAPRQSNSSNQPAEKTVYSLNKSKADIYPNSNHFQTKDQKSISFESENLALNHPENFRLSLEETSKSSTLPRSAKLSNDNQTKLEDFKDSNNSLLSRNSFSWSVAKLKNKFQEYTQDK